MARVLLVPVGSHGDVHPFVGIGRELKRRGHHVTLVTAAPFADLATKSGFDDFAPVGTAEDFESFLHNPDAWHPRRSVQALLGGEWFGRFLRQSYEHVAARYVRGETVVVGGSLALGARLAFDALGVPTASVHLQPLTLQSAADPPAFPQWPVSRFAPAWVARAAYWGADKYILDPMIAPPLNALRAELGLPPVRRVWGKWRHAPPRVLGLFPEWFASAPDWPPQTRLTGFVDYDQGGDAPLPQGLDEFLAAGPSPVVFSFGSAMRQGGAYFAAACDACARGGFRGLLLAKGGDQIPAKLPPGVAQFDYAPFSRVFPRAAAVVHHGGIGTTARALAAGVPQLIMPIAFDQRDNAIRVKRLGVGDFLPVKRFRGPAVAAVVNRLLGDAGVGVACRGVAAMFVETDPAGAAAQEIEALVGTDR